MIPSICITAGTAGIAPVWKFNGWQPSRRSSMKTSRKATADNMYMHTSAEAIVKTSLLENQKKAFWSATVAWQSKLQSLWSYIKSRIGYLAPPLSKISSQNKAALGSAESPLTPFLFTADLAEIDYASLLSDLSNLAYDITQLTKEELRRKHQLSLVALSSACRLPSSNTKSSGREQPSAERILSSSRVKGNLGDNSSSSTLKNKSFSFFDLQNPLSYIQLMSPVAFTVALSTYAPFSNISTEPHSPNVSQGHNENSRFIESPTPMSLLNLVAPNPAAESSTQQSSLPSITGLLMEETFSNRPSPTPSMKCSETPPSAWFVADDPFSRIRYFVIQGSTSVEQWQINFKFDPVVFEDPSLGVRIHRGVYESALKLYDDFLPLIKEHLESHPYATISFTGHSLGGSLAQVVMLICVIRGIIDPSSVAPIYTFGAPAVFCRGAVAPSDIHSCEHCQLRCEKAGTCRHEPTQSSDSEYPGIAHLYHLHSPFTSTEHDPENLLDMVGLVQDQIVNVIMHKDIVPRAFACDYTSVSHLLKSWLPGFRNLTNIIPGTPYKPLYSFIGHVAILSPADSAPFVVGDNRHDMLPENSALYILKDPATFLNTFHEPETTGVQAVAPEEDFTCSVSSKSRSEGCVVDVAANGYTSPSSDAYDNGYVPGPPVGDVQQAMLSFMNHPHPLTMLLDYRSYGVKGAISRYHNPDNYTKGLRSLLPTKVLASPPMTL